MMVFVPTAHANNTDLYNENEMVSPESSVGHIKSVSVKVYIGSGEYPPNYSPTYYYDDGLYSGTLRNPILERRAGGGTFFRYEWYATYRGQVVSYGGYPTNRIDPEVIN